MTNLIYEIVDDVTVLRAMPILLGALCVLAIAYRYYSAFLAAKVLALDDARPTPAHAQYDGQNYHPTNKWVLFGHHFAAISGAGPLIGPVLAIQYGYMPGLLWLLLGVCLAGGVQDLMVLAASVRCGGRSLAEIARQELGRSAAIVVSAAILFIVVVALSGLGFVVVKALGGEEITITGARIYLPAGESLTVTKSDATHITYQVPANSRVRDSAEDWTTHLHPEPFQIRVPASHPLTSIPGPELSFGRDSAPEASQEFDLSLPKNSLESKNIVELVPGSSWGTFTIACTVPIALFVGLYMYKIRKGRVVEASLLGALGVLAATISGEMIPGSALEGLFSLTRGQTVLALTGYGFIASVLPVWLLLCPRDYLSSFLKIGTIALLVVGVLLANPLLSCPSVNEVFRQGGPTFRGSIFPFVFICIMCGAVSGFHSLVSSGTSPKMVDKESHIRPIGYGAMLIEGLVGVVALLAAASMPQKLYYDINVDRNKVKEFRDQLETLYHKYPTLSTGGSLPHLAVKSDVAEVNKMVGGGESLRGRTGGAVTLAVGMALIFDEALSWSGLDSRKIISYWYHFAIMFEALFILTTIDTGTRIARFLLQEALGQIHPHFAQTSWLPGSILATFIVTAGWGTLIWTGSIDTIWPMFGIANQLLSVVALCLITTLLINTGRARYAWVSLLPMLFVTTTTMTAGSQMIPRFLDLVHEGQALKGGLNLALMVFVMACVGLLLLQAASRWIAVASGLVQGGRQTRRED